MVVLQAVSRFTTFALYQLTVLLGIVMLPVALAARRVGLRLPIRNLIEGMESAHESV